jgi:hypothetical protein
VGVTDQLQLNANLGFSIRSTWIVEPGRYAEHGSGRTDDLRVRHQAMMNSEGRSLPGAQTISIPAHWRAATPPLRQNAYGVPRDYESGDTGALTQMARRLIRATRSRSRARISRTSTSSTRASYNIRQFDFATVDRPREVGKAPRWPSTNAAFSALLDYRPAGLPRSIF